MLTDRLERMFVKKLLNNILFHTLFPKLIITLSSFIIIIIIGNPSLHIPFYTHKKPAIHLQLIVHSPPPTFLQIH